MSFYTSLTGLNSASAQLGVTSNNIANVGTTGFKRSRADFGDIFATSPLQKSSSAVGQGVSLKQVTQEFSQGNISFSSNALDLAISGDGFFPLKSADGLQDIYTRNGAFMLNQQFNVVNSAGQRLMAATVDSTGSANVNERVVLTIPQKTVGEARETKSVVLGVNFPADASVITAPFSRENAASYNKSTALTVYDAGGNGYLATIYYVKTQNATQGSPFNKWQTYVYVGNDEVKASLMQSTNTKGEKMYVNKYGDLQPLSVVKDFLTNNAKTQKFSLDQLTNKQVSQAASITGAASAKDLVAGIDFSTLVATENNVKSKLTNLFKIEVDGSSVNVDLSHLAKSSTPLTGTMIATELTNYLNTQFGDERYFEFPDAASSKINLTIGAGAAQALDLGYAVGTKKTTAEVLADLQTKVTAADNKITVSYDAVARTFKFVDTTAIPRSIAVSAPAANAVFGLTATPVTLASTGLMPNQVSPNSESFIRPVADQRFGMKVTYNTGDKTFNFASGTTGDASTISITPIDATTGAVTNDAGANNLAMSIFGLKTAAVTKSDDVALRGKVSVPAVAFGTAPSINMNNNFSVTAENNSFIVAVDDVRGTVTIPVGTDYSLAKFTKELEKQINLLADSTGKTVSGVKVTFDAVNQRFNFTTATATSSSFIKVSGKGPWGLEDPQSGLGTTSTWTKPTQAVEASGGTSKLVYIDETGKETTNGDGFTKAPIWTPIYLDKGELTFDTGGNIVSPSSALQLETVFLAGGKGALTININYSKSTQFTSPFAVLAQSQDGAPEGDLVGVTIANDGLVSASYSNGSQKSLAKILLVNFSNQSGLQQKGDSSFLASAASGNPILGTAGGAGFGTIRAGATERSNVDLTAELVDLITAQRNFQANAKAIETSTTMTQAIINIRG